MNRFVKATALVALLTAAGLATANAMTAKQIMGRLNKGPNALTPMLGKELRAGTPDWSEIQSQTKEYVKLATELGQAEPPKGDAGSWAKLTKEYAQAAQALDDAVQKQNKAGALAAHGKLTRSCTACHRAHRGT